jgi:hypothetical protein
VYVGRYGWNRRSRSLIAGAAVFMLLAVTVPMSLALQVVTLVFIASIATRRVALRVDASGATFGGSPGRYRSATRLIPVGRHKGSGALAPADALRPVHSLRHRPR